MGVSTGEVDLVTSDPMAKYVHIPLDCNGAIPSISVSPLMLNFTATLVTNPPTSSLSPPRLT